MWSICRSIRVSRPAYGQNFGEFCLHYYCWCYCCWSSTLSWFVVFGRVLSEHNRQREGRELENMKLGGSSSFRSGRSRSTPQVYDTGTCSTTQQKTRTVGTRPFSPHRSRSSRYPTAVSIVSACMLTSFTSEARSKAMHTALIPKRHAAISFTTLPREKDGERYFVRQQLSAACQRRMVRLR